MRKIEEVLSEMDKVLTALITNAEKLLDLSKRVIAEEELGPLQERQQVLLDELVNTDEAFHQACNGQEQDYHSSLRDRVTAKLEQFEGLNATFIENITSSQGLIHFEKAKKPKRKTKG